MKPLNVDFLISAFNSSRNLIWIQDSYINGSAKLVKEACLKCNYNHIELRLDMVYPIDLEETFSKLPNKPGIICIQEIQKSHEYIGSLIYPTLLYYQFRRSSFSNAVKIPDSWKFLMITDFNFVLPDRTLYRRFLKLINPREAINQY